MRSNTPSLPRGAIAAGLALGAGCLIAACGGGGGGSDGTASGQGSARFYLTDAPACGYDEVNVTVEKVRVHQSESAAEDDDGWTELVLSPARKINLLDLTNGVLEELGTVALPAGLYTQVRLMLTDNAGSGTPDNSLVLTGGDGSEIALRTPSGQQSGLKINTDFAVGAGQTADLVLDFDACKSVVKAGNSGNYNLKPVLRAIPVFGVAGQAIEGFLAPDLAGATVSAQAGGVPVKSTVAAADGKFVLSPVPAGSYDVVFTAPGYASAVITGVPVSETARTQLTAVQAPITPIALAVSGERTASGTTSLAGSADVPQATVRALQQLDGGPTLEIIARPVDADTGGYSFMLPTGAPGRAAYAAGATSYSFSADATATAFYTLEASAPEEATQSADIDVSTADANTDFVFP